MIYVIVYRNRLGVHYYAGKDHGVPCVVPDLLGAKFYKSYSKAFDVLHNVSKQERESYIGWSIEVVLSHELH